mgnify:CR=1 FL=1
MQFILTCSKYPQKVATRYLGSPSFQVEQPMCVFPIKTVNFGIRFTRWSTGNEALDIQLLKLKADRYTCAGCILVDNYGLFWTTQSSIDPILGSLVVGGLYGRTIDYLIGQWNRLTMGWWLVHKVDLLYYKELEVEPESTVDLEIGELCL